MKLPECYGNHSSSHWCPECHFYRALADLPAAMQALARAIDRLADKK